MKINLVWSTPDAENLLAYIARVSNPEGQDKPIGNLLAYCVKHEHWSVFEMASACFEIETTRDIARQILRHRSFSFQEFSQRYQTVEKLPRADYREARLQDHKNRQSSIETENDGLVRAWEKQQALVLLATESAYQWALDNGIAKEVARAVLPEGLTTSRMYMTGTVRSWMHYCKLRSGNGTQKEHAEIAKAISAEMSKLFPVSWGSLLEV